jgi:O-antigen ligase
MRAGLFGLILLTPLPFGSVQPGSVLIIELAAAVLGCGALWVLYHDTDALAPPAGTVLAACGALVLIGLLQLLPLPPSLYALVDAPTAETRRALAEILGTPPDGWFPASISAPDTTDALLRLVSYVVLGLCAMLSIRSRRQVRQLAFVVVISGLFQALYGSYEYLSGRQHIFGFAKRYYLSEATGTFINRNHYAGYLALTLPFALGILLGSARVGRTEGSWKQRLIRLAHPDHVARAFAAFAVFGIWTGVVLSQSRAGLAAAGLATVWIGAALFRGRWTIWLLAAALLLPTAYLLYMDVQAPGERMAELRKDITSTRGRVTVWKATAEMGADYPLLGTGYGTFEKAFPRYRPATVRLRWDHAHNDWLEGFSTGGVAVPLLFLFALFVTLRPLRWRLPVSSEVRTVAACAAAAVAAIAFHSTVDFCLRIPAIALLVACLAGVRISLAAEAAAQGLKLSGPASRPAARSMPPWSRPPARDDRSPRG